MPRGVKYGGRDFKPGHSIGRPKLPPELKAAKYQMTKTEFTATLIRFLKMDIYELEKIVKDKSQKVKDVWVARVCIRGIQSGDFRSLDLMADRLFGKAEGSQPTIEMNFSGLPPQEIIRRGEEALRLLQGEVEDKDGVE